jgi:catechol 2,3-dioxygenase-like lactoylglutathione lyase family enzyme
VGVVALDHVQVAAPRDCEGAAQAFYGGLLGLEKIAKPPALRSRGGVWFGLGGGQELHIGVEEPFVPASKAHPAFRVDSEQALVALADALGAAGHAVVWAAPGEIPARARFHVADPWGNRIELLADAGS